MHLELSRSRNRCEFVFGCQRGAEGWGETSCLSLAWQAAVKGSSSGLLCGANQQVGGSFTESHLAAPLQTDGANYQGGEALSWLVASDYLSKFSFSLWRHY